MEDKEIPRFYTIKFDTPEKRKQLCKDWCEHLGKGFTRECFPPCDPQTFKKYAKKFPEDFPKADRDEADRNQLIAWEERLHKNADKDTGNASSIKFGLMNINKVFKNTEDTSLTIKIELVDACGSKS